ncbi:rhodanese-like domain-containing protein [Chitinasiproducens palmae]|uniref:Rhodanese-related sulfurtransferase n=1 Tax=Chitinasiproducens palmae TaxID=1770053 RepID=A0A1H2PL17_9BURK|nr:rhodanese-like domain-containing protein [Chitinasiproducens palmae]SDV47161.1 Rhodanese-related sulfurtransferase [Chitinasiproducens palmae]
MTQPLRISPLSLRALLDHPPPELAILDVAEEGQFAERHLLHAVNVPYSQIEIFIGPLVPRLSTPIVLIDHGGGIGRRAASRLAALGYTDLSILDGGIAAWEARGFSLFDGVHVLSKAFGEWLERACATPSITAVALHERRLAKQATVILDPRAPAEHAARHVPGAASAPGQELLRVFDWHVRDPAALVVVACGGRTRGIVGAQTLIDAGVPNQVVALENGNHGWQLAGFEFETGAQTQGVPVQADHAPRASAWARRIRDAFLVPSTDDRQVSEWLSDRTGRTTYLLDVRTAREHARGHYRHARSAPGGQLVQATDRWLATRGARVVLVDDDGIRATPTALRLRQMGWDAYVLTVEHLSESGDGSGDSGTDGDAPSTPPDPDAAAYVHRQRAPIPKQVAEITPAEAVRRIEAGAKGISFDPSADYLACHPDGFEWSNRTDIAHLVDALETGRALVLFSSDTAAAHLAAVDLVDSSRRVDAVDRVAVVAGGMPQWLEAGLPASAAQPGAIDPARRIDWLQWLRSRRHGDAAAMRAYLAWEHGLLARIAQCGEPFPGWPGMASVTACDGPARTR